MVTAQDKMQTTHEWLIGTLRIQCSSRSIISDGIRFMEDEVNEGNKKWRIIVRVTKIEKRRR